MAILFERCRFFGPSRGAVLEVIFGTFLGRFWVDFKESPKSGRKAFSSIKPVVFAKGVNKNTEFYCRK